jgi:methylphosphotriester-DNA--protein-cysteine methyltransferase
MSELAERVESLRAVWGGDVSGIEDRLAGANSFHERVVIAESLLGERLSEKRTFDPWLSNAIDLISDRRGKTPISRIARDVGISERGLERHFRESIGLTPKLFSRIVRFQRVLKAIEQSPNPDIIDAAFEFGYYDQSHLIIDFRQFADKTPLAFMERARGITDVFVSGD